METQAPAGQLAPSGTLSSPNSPQCQTVLGSHGTHISFFLFPSPSPHLSVVSPSTLLAHPRSFTYRGDGGTFFSSLLYWLNVPLFQAPTEVWIKLVPFYTPGRGCPIQTPCPSHTAQDPVLLSCACSGQNLTGMLRALPGTPCLMGEDRVWSLETPVWWRNLDLNS